MSRIVSRDYSRWIVLPSHRVLLVDSHGRKQVVRNVDECAAAASGVQLGGRQHVCVGIRDTTTGAMITAHTMHFKGHRRGGMLHRPHAANHATDTMDASHHGHVSFWRNSALAVLLEQALWGRVHDVCAVMTSENKAKMVRTRGVACSGSNLLVELRLVSDDHTLNRAAARHSTRA